MGTTLQNGIYLPAEGERNCYSGLAANWTAIDGVIGGYSSHAANLTIHVTAADKAAWNGKADASALTAHTGNTTIHVTAEDKQAWNGKQDALSQTQLDAVNSGIDSSKVQQIATNTSDISSLQSGKANDSDVVHKSGNETVGGQKTFDSNTYVYNSDNTATTPYLFLKNSKTTKGSTSELGAQLLRFIDKNNNNLCDVESIVTSTGSCELRLKSNTFDSNNQNVQTGVTLISSINGTKRFCPTSNDNVSLGYSTLKWSDIVTAKVNSLEPSSLSLPSGNANDVIDISSYITNLDGTANSYTVPANGWISIAVVGTAINIVSSSWSDSRLRASSGDVRMLYPVLKNETLAISVTGTTLTYARFIPCQGNV